MNPFVNKKLRGKLEKCQRALDEKNKQFDEQTENMSKKDAELYRQEVELLETQQMFMKYKIETDAKLIKNEEIIEKLSERWDTLENNFFKKEEQLRSRLDQLKNTQEAMLKKLEIENETKTKVIEEYQENIKRQVEKIQLYEDQLKQAVNENEHLKKEMELRGERINKYAHEVQLFQQRCENLEKEILNLNSKIDMYHVEMENKRIQIEHLYSESNIKTEKVRELENKLLHLEETKGKLEMEKKEEVDRLKKVIDSKKKELQDKIKQIDSLKNKVQILIDTERDLKEVNDQNTILKKDMEEKNKSIKHLKHENLNKDDRINDLQSQVDSIKKDLTKQEDLVNKLESTNKSLQHENYNIQERYEAEKHNHEETVNKFKEKNIHNEKIIEGMNENVKKLEDKLKESERGYIELDAISKMEVQRYKDAIKSLEQSKNITIENLESSEKRALECLCQKNETIKYLEKDLTDKESDLTDKEQEIRELKKKVEELVTKNEMLEFKVHHRDEIKKEDVDNIHALVRNQVDTINNAYQIEWETRENQKMEFIKYLEHFVSKQITDHETHLRVIDNLRETTEQLIEKTNSKIETYTIKMKEHKVHLESLQRLITDLEVQNEEIKKEIIQKDMLNEMQKKQVDANYKLLQNEILKSEIGNTFLELSNEMNVIEENATPAIENILRQIHTRNVVMRELREDINIKQEMIIRLQEKYQKLSDKIKRVVVTVTNAKIAYQDLEKENRRLKNILVQKKFIHEATAEGSDNRLCTKAGTTTLSEAYSDYDLRVRKELAQSSQRSSEIAPPLNLLFDELESIKESSRKEILNLNQHTGLLTNIDFLKTEIQKERKLRKKQEALFTSVINTLKPSSCKIEANNTERIERNDKSKLSD